MFEHTEPVQTALSDADIRQQGLKPTACRVLVLQALRASQGTSLHIEDIYRELLAQRSPLSISTIAHALVDLERAALLEQVSQKSRRKFYRSTRLDTKHVAMRMRLPGSDRAVDITDPRLLELLTRFLQTDLQLDLGPYTEETPLQFDVWS